MENEWWRRLVESAKRIIQEDERRAKPPTTYEERERVTEPNELIRIRITPRRGVAFEMWIDPDKLDELLNGLNSYKGVKIPVQQLGRTRTLPYKYPQKVERWDGRGWVRVDKR